MGGLGLAGFASSFGLGAQHTTAVNLGITQGAIPAFVVLSGLLVFGTPVGKLLFRLAAVTLRRCGADYWWSHCLVIDAAVQSGRFADDCGVFLLCVLCAASGEKA